MLGWQDFTLILDDLGTLCLESGHAAMLEVMWQVPKAKSSVQAVMVGDAGNLAFCSEKEMCFPYQNPGAFQGYGWEFDGI